MRQTSGGSGHASSVQPFLRWAGGKRWVADPIRRILSESGSLEGPGRAYAEPFLGGGACFFRIGPSRAYLSDVNEELIEAFLAVAEYVERVVDVLGSIDVNADAYAWWRELDPAALSRPERAARLIFLMATCFNGIYRVNRSGQFNVPYGRPTAKDPVCVDRVRRASVRLRGATIRCMDFRSALAGVGVGTAVYLDPPYGSGPEGQFNRYSAMPFGSREHGALQEWVEQFSQAGGAALLSLSAEAFGELGYQSIPGLTAFRIVRSSRLAGRAHGRSRISEMLVSTEAVSAHARSVGLAESWLEVS